MGSFTCVELIVLGTNAIATAQVPKAGANKGASNENAVCRAIIEARYIIETAKAERAGELRHFMVYLKGGRQREKHLEHPGDYDCGYIRRKRLGR